MATFWDKSCPPDWACVHIVFCLFVNLVISRFCFEDGVWFLIAQVPVHCLLVIFVLHVDALTIVFRKYVKQRLNRNDVSTDLEVHLASKNKGTRITQTD